MTTNNSDIIDDTLDTLRDQRDAQQEVTQRGRLSVNTAIFSLGKFARYSTFGPVSFEASYQGQPDVAFGQIISTEGAAATKIGHHQIKGPFIGQPVVHEWVMNGGLVAGFIMGLYALSDTRDLSTHAISWVAVGKATAYKEANVNESWEQPYDNQSTDFFTETTNAGNNEIT